MGVTNEDDRSRTRHRHVLILLLLSLMIADPSSALVAGAVNRRQKRIADGNPAQLGEFQYQVAIVADGLHRCGGAIYAQNAVITSASCCNIIEEANQAMLIAGDLYPVMNQEVAQQKPWASGTVRHPDHQIDLCVVFLDGQFTYNDLVGPVPLNDKEVPAGTVCKVSGWGATKDTAPFSSKSLMYGEVPMMSREDCLAYYLDEGSSQSAFVPDIMACAGYSSKAGSPAPVDDWPRPGPPKLCDHDEGDPLICNGRLAAVSISSIQCKTDDEMGLYANVTHFKQWIEQTVAVGAGVRTAPLGQAGNAAAALLALLCIKLAQGEP